MQNCDRLISQLMISAPTDIISTTDQVVSARKAVDFLDGDQVPWMEQLLSCQYRGIKDWRKRGFFPIVEDFLGMVIRRSANTYQDQPKRTLYQGENENEALSDAYSSILEDNGAKFVTNDIDELSRLLKVSFTLVQYSSEARRFLFSNLARHNAAVVYDQALGRVTELLYTAEDCTADKEKVFHHWTIDEIRTLAWNGGRSRMLDSAEPNPYGMIPLAIRYDISPPRQGFWPAPAWDQLIYANEAINLFHTTTAFASSRANIGQFFTNAKLPSGTVFGVDTTVEMESSPGEPVFAEYRIPTEQVAPFSEWLNKYKESIAEQWGVNLKIEGYGNTDSGFKLIVEEFPALELRNKRISSAEIYERQLFDAVAAVARVAGVQEFGDAKLKVQFAPPRLPVNEKEQHDIMRERVAIGVSTRRDYLEQIYPDATERELDEKEAELAAAARTAQPPAFDRIANAE